MKNVLVAVAVTVSLVGAGVGALYALDSSRDDEIAHGITVAGVEVGGMNPREARGVLERRIVSRLDRTLTAKYRNRRFVLPARTTDVRVDLDAMVREALEKSRDGNFVGRAIRDVFEREVDADVSLRVSYSRASVKRFVGRIVRAIERRPREAKVVPSPTGLRTTASRNGVRVAERKLTRAIARRVVSLDGRNVVRVPAAAVEPKVTTGELADKYRYFITISKAQKQLRLFHRLKLVKTYRIAVGQAGYETPVGLYRIFSKAENPAWKAPDAPWAGDLAGKIIPPDSPDNPIEARWMEFHDGAGIHGTAAIDSIGTAASHGCIRMTVPDVVELYDRVPVQTPIYIG